MDHTSILNWDFILFSTSFYLRRILFAAQATSAQAWDLTDVDGSTDSISLSLPPNNLLMSFPVTNESNSSSSSFRNVHVNGTPADNPFVSNSVSNTKYTPTNFLFKNFGEQFSRFMNRYFLLIGVLQLWNEITPVNPITTWFPLAVVFTISAIKEGFDDYFRWQMDKQFNNRIVHLIRDNEVFDVPSHSLLCGDIIYVAEDEEFPADVLILTTSNEDGSCFIQTMNLDGETNLKPRVGVSALRKCSPVSLSELRGVIQCAKPNPAIYKFDSNLTISKYPEGSERSSSETTFSLESTNVALQSTFLKNTEWICGTVVYTGNETKIGQNKHLAGVKWTRIDKFLNKVTGFIFAMQMIFVIFFGIYGNLWKQKNGRNHFYLRYVPAALERDYEWAIIPLRFELLMSIMVPISLKVTLDICKYLYARFINWDIQMWDPDSGPANASSSSLSEDLGQVQYIFSDKTGTLTENFMVFRKCSIGGSIFGHSVDLSSDTTNAITDSDLLRKICAGDEQVVDFFRALSVCHTVIATYPKPIHQEPNEIITTSETRETGPSSVSLGVVAVHNATSDSIENLSKSIQYKSSSPDEEALVKASAALGFSFISKSLDNTCTIRIDPKKALDSYISFQTSKKKKKVHGFLVDDDDDENLPSASSLPSAFQEDWILLATLDFSSERKRMSVILKNTLTGKLLLYCKGADDVILPRLHHAQNLETLNQTQSSLSKFASQGLRTLVVARKEVSAPFFNDWKDRLDVARCAVDDRDLAVARVYDEMETNLELLGVTAIEDRLQPDVPETIADLRKAQIRIWMLTGDKYETAKQIAISCNLLQPHDKLFPIVGETPEEIEDNLEKILTEVLQLHKKFCLIIRGRTLELAIAACESRFLQLSLMARSVICCRTTPQQKAQTVRMVKNRNFMTLAIGDGGNDVSMIQEANVGIGIIGREGLQAARAADYSFGKFRHLARLILIHGRYSVYRTSYICQYSFYKNLFLSLINVFYAFQSGFSGSTFFSTFAITTYNAVFTALPVIFYVLDKDVNEETVLSQPRLYIDAQKGNWFNWSTFFLWLLRAFLQAIIVSTFVLNIYAVHIDGTRGFEYGYQSVPMVAYTIAILVQTFTMLTESRNVTFINSFWIWGTLCSYFIIMAFITTLIGELFQAYYVFFHLYGDPVFWATCLVSTVSTIFPWIAIHYWNYWYHPTAADYCSKIQSAAKFTYVDGTKLTKTAPDALFRDFRGGQSIFQTLKLSFTSSKSGGYSESAIHAKKTDSKFPENGGSLSEAHDGQNSLESSPLNSPTRTSSISVAGGAGSSTDSSVNDDFGTISIRRNKSFWRSVLEMMDYEDKTNQNQN